MSAQTGRGNALKMDSRDIALISVFAAVWMVAQITLGPIIGRFSVGLVSLHGVVNRVVGWMRARQRRSPA
jgi:hypothetical protein